MGIGSERTDAFILNPFVLYLSSMQIDRYITCILYSMRKERKERIMGGREEEK